MNILTIIVVVILGAFMFRGYKNGLAKSIVSSLTLVFTIVAVAYLTPSVTDFLENNTGIHDAVTEQCEKVFLIHMDDLKAQRQAGATVSMIHNAMIDQLDLPDVIKDGLKSHNNAENYKALGVRNFNEYVPKYIADLIVRVIVFVISWILSLVILYFLVKALKLVTEIPGIKGMNRLLGIALGLAQGLIFVWVLFLIITMIGGTSSGAKLLGMIADDNFLSFLYDNNLVMRLIQTVAQRII